MGSPESLIALPLPIKFRKRIGYAKSRFQEPYGGDEMIQSYQKEFIGKAKKDFKRLPEGIKATVMGYVSRGFWFVEVIDDRKT
ncbi:MAG: hypothetical protein HC924_18085 [Synechococcaceae cyanobacterium SM2_3_2]|nr:hypothetical protein [Synechococcaceae cyanobacterium SM2_3_2]